MKYWLARLAPALVLGLCQLSLVAQTPSQNGSWADDIYTNPGSIVGLRGGGGAGLVSAAAWLDKYVKNPQKAEPAKKITTESSAR